MSDPYRDRQVDLDFTLVQEWRAYGLHRGLDKLALAFHRNGNLEMILARLRQVKEARMR